MSGAIPTLPPYAFMAWCLVKAQGQLYLLPVQLLVYVLGDWGSTAGSGWEFFSSPQRSDRFWGPPSPLSNGYQGALSLGVKRPGRKVDHSPPSSAEVKECVELYLHSPIRFHGVVLN
jgi:hypothetical protein